MAAVQAVTSACPYVRGDCIADKYRLQTLIGTGGMCTVWIAEHVGLERRVALKFPRSDLPVSEEGRLLREARALGRIEHPAVIRIFDYGETAARHPFIVMELLEGASLADSLDADGRMSPIAACRTLLPVLDGLSVVHGNGIVHRDLKPENIFLAREPGRIQPKLLDFGLAKFETRDPKPRLTMSGTVLGSPAYMAPEQARGLGDVDHRSDVWAACVVIYEAVAGQPPFRGANYNAVLRSIVEDDIPPLWDRGGGEAALWSILSRGLTKERAGRIPSIHALGVALAGFLLERGVETDITGSSIRPVWSPGAPVPKSTKSSRTESMRATPPDGGSVIAVTMIRTRARRRRTAALGVSLVAGLVAGGAVALSPASLELPAVNPNAIAETARRGSEEVATAVAHAASLVVQRTTHFAEREVDASPPPLETAEPPKPRPRAAALTGGQPSAKRKRVERAAEVETPKRREEPPTNDEALRALGLKVPYR